MDALGVGHSEEAAYLGFEAYAPDPGLPAAEFSRLQAGDYAALTEAWRDLILRRREQDGRGSAGEGER
jgi:hypothetical protein